MPGVHFGVEIADNMDSRISIDSNVKTSLLTADILNVDNQADGNSNYYIGSGLDIFFQSKTAGIFPIALHFTAAYEYIFEDLGIFAEVQPMLSFNQILLRTKLGLNIHF